MAYTELTNERIQKLYKKDNLEKKSKIYSLEEAVRKFIAMRCEGLRFDEQKAEEERKLAEEEARKSTEEGEKTKEEKKSKYFGTSIAPEQIPYNMEKDIDRLCLQNAMTRFLESGKKEDAFDVYFCYLEMFIGDYDKTRRMIELLSEFEANGSSLLMKHRDHYSHSVYVFALGLAIYETNTTYRTQYENYYHLSGREAAAHFLQFWGLSALFHDIGYPFELPFEQVCSYFEVGGEKRKNVPFLAYQEMERLVMLDHKTKEKLKLLDDDMVFETTNELFAYLLAQKLGTDPYAVTKEAMVEVLKGKPAHPDKFNNFMDHAYFSANILFKQLFVDMDCPMQREHLDALTAILMHNSLYKFSIASFGENDKNKWKDPFKMELHPLAYLLMLCDELQCWDRTSYGRNSKTELHPMNCIFEFSGTGIHATYMFDEKEIGKINKFKDEYIAYLGKKAEAPEKAEAPKLKAYSSMYVPLDNGISEFQDDIQRIVDLTVLQLTVDTGVVANTNVKNRRYLSDSNFLNLYNFAIVLNGRWSSSDWKKAKEAGREEDFILNKEKQQGYIDDFKKLSLEYKLSNINQAKAFAKYMNEINCFYTDKPVDFEMLENFSDVDLTKIGVLEHQRWLQEHFDMGWEYGEPKDKSERELSRCHVDMIPRLSTSDGKVSIGQAEKNYARLSKEEQDKDTEPMECMLAMLKMFCGIRIYRLN